MSKILNFTATATLGPANGGFRMGGIALVAGGAAAAATITEIVGGNTFTRVQLSALASTMAPFNSTDVAVGMNFEGVCVLSTLSGAGASVNVEEM